MNFRKQLTAKIVPIDESISGSNNNSSNNNDNNNNTENLKDSSSNQSSSTRDDETLDSLFQKAGNNNVLNDNTSFDLGSTNFLYTIGSTTWNKKLEDTTGWNSGVNSTVAGIVTGVTSAVVGIVSDATVPNTNDNGTSSKKEVGETVHSVPTEPQPSTKTRKRFLERIGTNKNNNNDTAISTNNNNNNNSFFINGRSKTIIHKDIGSIIDELISPKSDLHVKYRKNKSGNKIDIE